MTGAFSPYYNSEHTLEELTQITQKEEEQRDHGGRRYVIPSPDQTPEGFRHTQVHDDSQ
jgi:hypothetical protein